MSNEELKRKAFDDLLGRVNSVLGAYEYPTGVRSRQVLAIIEVLAEIFVETEMFTGDVQND